jgi:rsbT co-antagonist protein RsbR
MTVDYMARLKLDDREIESRRAFFEIGDDDLRRLQALRPIAEKHTEAVIEEFYQLIMGHPGSRAFFPDEATLARVKRHQRDYFLGLFGGQCDRRYVEDRLRVGAAHQRVGIEPKWYVGAYSRYLRLLLRHFLADLPASEARAAYESLVKLVTFDMALALDTYIAANLDALARHQAAIRELSTPVIRVYERVLLLPLVGTVDSHRAQQIMETLLARVVEEQARAVIVDIAGVPVVDTAVADHLLKTTEAVRLLGADTIVSGISAQVARTIVQLGVDISSIHTRARLADAIQLALGLLGKAIMETADASRNDGVGAGGKPSR